jgi:glycosyltransferase involved in cell wall biosynthesis
MDEPIRVLQVFAQMNRGGAESMIMNLYRYIDRKKVQFDFIVHTDEKCVFDDEIELLGGKIFNVDAYEGKNHIAYKRWWNNFFKAHPEYKIVHGHVRSTASIYLKIAKKYGLITIAHSHSTSSGTGAAAVVKNILQYPIRYTADYFLACSNPAGMWLFGKKTCQKNNYFVLNNAIDAKKFICDENRRKDIRKSFQMEDKFVIGHIGRFDDPKNHEFLIEIFKKVHEKKDNAVLILVGDGKLRYSIEKKVANMGLSDSIVFTGVRSDISELLQAMDAFVFPSLFEGLGIVVIEAQASGLPCIVSDVLPQEVYVTNLIQTISLKESESSWAEKVLAYDKGYERRNTYEQMKSSGYDIRATAKWVQDLYLRNWNK